MRVVLSPMLETNIGRITDGAELCVVVVVVVIVVVVGVVVVVVVVVGV